MLPARGASREVVRRFALPLGLVVLAALVVPAASFGGRVLFDRDVHLTWHAHATAFVAAIRDGCLPLWDPHFGFGQPHLGNPQTQTLYPPTWLLLVLPPWRYYTLLVVGHLALAGIGVARLVDYWGGSRLAAFVGGGLFLASGPVVSQVNMWHQLCGAAWLPWAWLAADRLCATPNIRAALRLSGVLGIQVLAGSGELSLMTGLLVAVRILAGVPWRAGIAAHGRRLLGNGAVALVLTALLTAPQWAPTLELTRVSMRSRLTQEMRTFWSVHPPHALQTLLPVPLPRLHVPADDDPHLPRETLEPFLYSLYLGLPTLALAVAGLTRNPRRTGLLVLLACGLLFGFGRHAPAYEAFVTLVPPLRLFRFPVKAMLLVALPWALLAAHGVDVWRGGAMSRGVRFVAGLALAGGIAGLLALPPLSVSLDPWPTFPLQRPPEVAAALAGLVAVACISSVSRSNARMPTARHVAWLAAAASLIDLMSLHAGLNATAPVELFTSTPPTIEAIRRDRARLAPEVLLPPRVHVWDYARTAPGRARSEVSGFYREVPLGQPPHLARARGLQAYLHPFVPGRFELDGSYSKDLFNLYPGPLHDLTLVVREAEDTPALVDLLAMGGVEYVMAVHDEGLGALERLGWFPGFFREPLRLFRAPRPLPRAHVVDTWRRADGHAAYSLLLSGGIDLVKEALVAAGDGNVPTLPAAGPPGRASILRRVAGTLALEAEMARDGLVVVSDAFDPGWHASVDGRPTPLRRANVAFRGVAVPAGRHRIEMRYRPRGLYVGIALWAAGLVVIAGLLVLVDRGA